jgi:hypothetical protein
MSKRIKRALVDSYIGAIGLGYLLAQVMLYFISIFSAPVTGWIVQNQSPQFMSRPISTGLPLQNALPQLIDFVLLLCLWYILLRWLYLEKPAGRTSVKVPDQEQSA